METAHAKGGQTDPLPINRRVVEALTIIKESVEGEWIFMSRSGQPFESIRTAFTNVSKHANLATVARTHSGIHSRVPAGDAPQGRGRFRPFGKISWRQAKAT